MASYVWRHRELAVPAAKVVAELERLRKRLGDGITAEALVQEAARRGSPLAPLFEWDDERAANEHRLQEAREIMRSILVVEKGKEPRPWLITIRDERPKEGSHAPRFKYVRLVEDVLPKPDLTQQVLHRAAAELASWRRKYGMLRELARVHEVIDEELNRLLSDEEE